MVCLMAIKKRTFPSDQKEQYIVRFPEGMRDRIKKAAEENGRSMNAEIVQALENAYPAPRPEIAVAPLLHAGMIVLNWRDSGWHYVDWETWGRFRTSGDYSLITEHQNPRNVYFVVAVFDDKPRIVNVIVHNYLQSHIGYVSAGIDYLSEQETEEYADLMTAISATPDDTRRLKELQDQMSPAFKLPKESIATLRKALATLANEGDVDEVLKARGILAPQPE